ncbi:GPW/gp25 family protein [Brevundimonas nasdae]|uniref:GPW/gp25 family protein n=1 Tax=Brevundimonas nasdae TaxID=172043 RepID=UPI003F6906C4
MAAGTGKPIDGLAHLRQSIADILTTPVGSRIKRREYGSQLFDLIDQPFNSATRMRLFGAVATALARWEPRIRLTALALSAGDIAGSFVLRIEGVRTDLPERSALTALDLNLQLGGVAGLALS